MHKSIFIFLLISFHLCGLCKSEEVTQQYYDSLPKIQGKTLIFSNGKRYKTSLYDLKFVGQLQSKTKGPYFILSGRSCTKCDENLSIYLWCPKDGPMPEGLKLKHYSYPGTERDLENNQILYQSDMYFGNCSIYGSSIIWIQKTLMENKKWLNDVFILQVDGDKLKEITLKRSLSTQVLSALHNCKKLKGIDVTSEP